MEKSIQQSVVSASYQVNKQSAQMGANISKSIDIAANNAKAQTDLSNEKLSRLVDILKAFAAEQSKIDQELRTLTASQGKVDQVFQGQKELDATQKKITEALNDLRRKANVNISRTDAILKKIKKQK